MKHSHAELDVYKASRFLGLRFADVLVGCETLESLSRLAKFVGATKTRLRVQRFSVSALDDLPAEATPG